MSFNSTTCGNCYTTQDFYGRYVPQCPRCGSINSSKPMTAEEYYRSMGVPTTNNSRQPVPTAL